MTTEKMLQEIQDKIWDKTLSTWCKISDWKNDDDKIYTFLSLWPSENKNPPAIVAERRLRLNIWKIIWHPISLARILSSLGEWYTYSHFYDTYGVHHSYIYDLKDKVYNRKLLNENWSDCMLDNQSPETIKAIWEIVCK